MARLIEHVRSATALPVLATGGPPRAPFVGEGSPDFRNPAWALHHARSWSSSFVLGGMLSLNVVGMESGSTYTAATERWASGLAECVLLQEGQEPATALNPGAPARLPLVGQVWGPLTMVSAMAGADETFRMLATDPAAVDEWVGRGLARTLEHVDAVLDAGAEIVWVSEPMIVPVASATVERHAVAPLRQVGARVSSAGRDMVVHVSGNAAHIIEQIVAMGAQGISITAETSLADVRDGVPKGFVVFGNLSAHELTDLDEEGLAARACEMASTMAGAPYVVTPGSALGARVPVTRLATFLDQARSHVGLSARTLP